MLMAKATLTNTHSRKSLRQKKEQQNGIRKNRRKVNKRVIVGKTIRMWGEKWAANKLGLTKVTFCTM